MNRAARRKAGLRTAPSAAPGCEHCGVSRIVMPLSIMRGFARKHAALVDLLGALEHMREHYAENEYVSLCPGCFCLTGDLSPEHTH